MYFTEKLASKYMHQIFRALVDRNYYFFQGGFRHRNTVFANASLFLKLSQYGGAKTLSILHPTAR